MTAPNREAVEAAAEALCDRHNGHGFYASERTADEFRWAFRDEAESALTAALPFLAPQPSRSDEERAKEITSIAVLGYGHDSATGDEIPGVTWESLGMAEKAIALDRAAVRAEATLAGAVAERDRIADWAEKTFVNGPVNIAAAIRARRSTP